MNQSYRILDNQSVLEVAAPFLSSPPVSSEEIGDGNVNLVFRVKSETGSVIIKQAVPYLRIVGESWPLTKDRARIEAEALSIQYKLAPQYVPRLHAYLPGLAAQVLEDLRGYEVLRRGMCAQREYPKAFSSIAIFAARTLLGTSDILMPAAEKKALCAQFQNPELCAITEDLVFTSPFIDSPSNQIDDALRPAAIKLRENKAAVRAAAMLRFMFKTRAEAIIHGDLHSGSVMVSPDDTRVIDAEFACPGPIAFDIGKFIGNLALSFLGHRAQGNHSFAAHVARWANEFITTVFHEMRSLWPSHEPWREAFLAKLIEESSLFAGAVMCRRTVGLAGVADIRGIESREVRLTAEQAALAGGASLLTSRVQSFDDLWGLATESTQYQ
jgi:5-methylthioribose kinase